MDNPGIDLAALAEKAGDHLRGLSQEGQVTVTGASYDSRDVRPGDLFFCIPGERFDGHRFASTAVESGAVSLCVERPTEAGVPELVVDSVRAVMAGLSAEIYGRPSEELLLLGVTGTNGKTTTAFLLESILQANGRSTGLIGTIETRVAGQRRPGVRTTPESVDLQRLFRQMRDEGVTAAAMEVTSHALVLGRVDEVRYDSAVFTNLTQDHLDFHKDMASYFEAKASLFTQERAQAAVINRDDRYGQVLLERTELPTLTFGSSEPADVFATDVDLGSAGSTFTAVTPEGKFPVATHLAGPFNILNCLAAIASALQTGSRPEEIAHGIESLKAVPGRFETIDAGQPFTVVVDYAHTPDSLDNVLAAAKPLAASRGGRVVTVFGCGGDRDRGKRPLMGTAATRGSDVVIVTSDNPRSEDPEAIIGEILEGVIAVRAEGPDATFVDRRAAIAHAVEVAGEGDVVVVAGKGHETGQEFADETIPFDDRVVVTEALEERGWGDGTR